MPGVSASQYRQTSFIINKRFGDRVLRRMTVSSPYDANGCLSDANGCDFGKADVIKRNALGGEVSTFGKRLSAGRLTFDAYRRLC